MEALRSSRAVGSPVSETTSYAKRDAEVLRIVQRAGFVHAEQAHAGKFPRFGGGEKHIGGKRRAQNAVAQRMVGAVFPARRAGE